MKSFEALSCTNNKSCTHLGQTLFPIVLFVTKPAHHCVKNVLLFLHEERVIINDSD